MAILNYTTSIASEKTAMEIQTKLAKAKAQAVLCEYDDAGHKCAECELWQLAKALSV